MREINDPDLTTRSPYQFGDLVERHGEHVVQHEREAFCRVQSLEDDLQRDPDRVREQRFVLGPRPRQSRRSARVGTRRAAPRHVSAGPAACSGRSARRPSSATPQGCRSPAHPPARGAAKPPAPHRPPRSPIPGFGRRPIAAAVGRDPTCSPIRADPCHTAAWFRVIPGRPLQANRCDRRCLMARIQGVSKREAGPDDPAGLQVRTEDDEEADRPRAADRQRDRADGDLGPPAEDDDRDGQVQPGGAQGEVRRRAAQEPGRAEGRADDRLRVLRRPRLADLPQLRLLRRGAAGAAATARATCSPNARSWRSTTRSP